MPEAPDTLEGWYALHDFRRIDWPRWKTLAAAERAAIVAEAAEFLEAAEAHRDAEEGASALYRIVGHKADLMFLHLRPTVDQLKSWLQEGSDPVHDPATGITIGRLDIPQAARLIPAVPSRPAVSTNRGPGWLPTTAKYGHWYFARSGSSNVK